MCFQILSTKKFEHKIQEIWKHNCNIQKKLTKFVQAAQEIMELKFDNGVGTKMGDR